MEVQIRCKGSEEMRLVDMIPFQGNLKDLSDKNYLKLKNQILNLGFIAPIFIWEDKVTDGHQRLKTLLRMKEEGITMPDAFPIIKIDAPDEKTAKKMVLSLSSQYGKMTEESLFDFSAAADINFEELNNFEFDAIDFKDFEKEYFDNAPGPIEGEDEVPTDAPTISKLGDIWHLGNHKIMNGDCTVEENVKRLMGDEKADMVFTDPPYGINYQSNHRIEKHELIENDNQILDFSGFINNFSIGFVFIWTAWNVFSVWEEATKKIGKMTNLIIWDKEQVGFGDLKKTFRTNFEMAMVFNRGKEFFGKRIGSIWRGSREGQINELHPTQKPIFLAEQAIQSCTLKEEIVADIFLGSGSTLIACEKTNRKCFGMEISEAYCSVIIKRYIDFVKSSENIFVEREGIKYSYAEIMNEKR